MALRFTAFENFLVHFSREFAREKKRASASSPTNETNQYRGGVGGYNGQTAEKKVALETILSHKDLRLRCECHV